MYIYLTDWFVNGKPLQSAARFKSAYDFGFVTLDIHHAYSEDSGIYTCRASNSKGQAVTTGTLKCTGNIIKLNVCISFKFVYKQKKNYYYYYY